MSMRSGVPRMGGVQSSCSSKSGPAAVPAPHGLRPHRGARIACLPSGSRPVAGTHKEAAQQEHAAASAPDVTIVEPTRALPAAYAARGRAPPVLSMAPLDPNSSVYVADPPSPGAGSGGTTPGVPVQRFRRAVVPGSQARPASQLPKPVTHIMPVASAVAAAPPAARPSSPPVVPTPTPPPPSAATAPPPPAVDVEVDSRRYMREVINLSVELDHAEEEQEENEEGGKGSDDSIDIDNYTTGLGSTDEEEEEAEVEEEVEEPVSAEPKVSAVRLAAQALMASLDVAAHIGERHHWMIITAPETLVAGEEAVILFNRAQSDALRTRPRIQLRYGFNTWELLGEDGASMVTDMAPAPCPRAEGFDFWWARFQVPDKAFELNFVLSDGEACYENNGGLDFMFPVVEGMDREAWGKYQVQVALAREAARAEAQRRAAEEEELRRQEALRQQDADRGKAKAEELARRYEGLQAKGSVFLRQGGKADSTAPVLWTADPPVPLAGTKVKLYYNRAASPLHWIDLPQDQALTLTWGINGWQGAVKVLLERCVERPTVVGPKLGDNEEWWVAELDLPPQTALVDFVVNYFEHYDNNDRKDHAMKVGLPVGLTFEAWLEKLTEMYRTAEFEARVAAEEVARQKEMRRQEKRQKARDLVLAVERRKVRHVLFTEPEVIKAGEEVTIWYNPTYTTLAGRDQLYLTCGFNRWTHKAPIGPLALTPPDIPPSYDEHGVQLYAGEVRSGSPTHWKATFQVPPDAYKMDFVFSDVPGGEGTYDNRGGYDYHLPIAGCPFKEPSLYVVHIAVEMAPVAKVGGLGDVVTALGRAVKEQGHLVEVILPKYEFLNGSPILNGQMRYETEFDWGGTRIVVSTAVVEDLRVWLIEPQNQFFQTQTVYGRYDDEVRFDFFCKAALEFLLRSGRQPDILHCHDWSSAHVAKAYWDDYHPYGLWKPRVVFTIHNLNYGQKKLSEAAFFCQKFTTVSPTYAFETGGTPIIAPHVHKFCGIRNGIDSDLWDPENNMFLPAPIVPEAVAEGKAAARAELRKRLNLTTWNDKFIVAVVSRLTPQKGVHLIKHTAYRTVDRGGQFVLLGSAPDPKVQAEFNDLASSMSGQDSAFCFKYDEPLSHLIYAAADMIVVPSMFEPCGLTQMIAMRYGAVPVVRHTGGLKDTVFDVDFDKERAAWDIYGSSDWQRDGVDATNGFAFEGTDPGALDYALNRAIDAWYNDRPWFHSLQRRVMEQDWTWNRPGLDYIELYFTAIKQ